MKLNFYVVLVSFIVYLIPCKATVLNNNTIDRNKIAKLLKEASQRDQQPRLIIDSLMRVGVTDGNLYLPAIQQQQYADSINLEIVLPIIDILYKNKIYDLDTDSYNSCWLIIQHAENSIQYKYKDFIDLLAAKSLISKSSYMVFIDRLCVRKHQLQLYGMQFKRFENGLFMEYPTQIGKDDRLKLLKYEKKGKFLIPDDYKISYSFPPINKGEYVVCGFLFEGEKDSSVNDCIPLNNIDFFIEGTKIATTDSNGFFGIILTNNLLSKRITAKIDGKDFEYKLPYNQDADFFISKVFFNGNVLYVYPDY